MNRIVLVEPDEETLAKMWNAALECGFHIGNIRRVGTLTPLRDRGRGYDLAIVGVHPNTPDAVQQSSDVLASLDGIPIIAVVHAALTEQSFRDHVMAKAKEIIPLFAVRTQFEEALRKRIKTLRGMYQLSVL